MSLSNHFIKPRYDSGGFAGIPQRIRGHLASGQYDAVVLFLVDGLGWRFIERFQDAPFVKRLARDGTLEKLTSQFPSTTAAHVTTIHTGLPVGESGVYEWFYYEPLLDRVIAPLLFSFAGELQRDTLKGLVDAKKLYPTKTLYNAWRNDGIESHVFGIRDYTPSTYSNVVMKGAKLNSFKTLSEALINLGLLLEKQTKPTYVHFYFDKIDGLCHEYGPDAPQAEAEIETFFLIMEHYFMRIFPRGKRVLFLMTADHGSSEVDPQTTVFLNTDARFAGVERFLKTNRNGEFLVPAGSARDMFLYIKDDLLDEAQSFLASRLNEKAEVVKVSELINEGYFGPTISPEFRSRVGNLVILSHRYESVWWYVKDKFEQRYYGHHGGLTPQEMKIPLFTCAR
ncbi:MAG: alkaline phosphatase family protein [Anaerolineaceae bacterium]|nr:MAG: alkaline phosphatase family protein [Anaerolineaceae bacterium]